jgi:hypothetical protein
MGDMGEMFNEWREDKKKKKASNLEFSTNELIKRGVSFESKNGGVHLVIESLDGLIDFWPSTGKFKVRASNEYKRGLRNLLKHLD